MIENMDGRPYLEFPSKGVLIVLDEIADKYGQGPRREEPEVAVELAIRYSFLRLNEAKSVGDYDAIKMWKDAIEQASRNRNWTYMKNSIEKVGLPILESENGDERRKEYTKALQNLFDSF